VQINLPILSTIQFSPCSILINQRY